jgi:hypothetical protein
MMTRVPDIESVRRASLIEEEYRGRRNIMHNLQMYHLLYLHGPPFMHVPLNSTPPRHLRQEIVRMNGGTPAVREMSSRRKSKDGF